MGNYLTVVWNYLFGKKSRSEGALSPMRSSALHISELSRQLCVSAAFAAYRRLCSDCAGLAFDVRNEEGMKIPRARARKLLPALKPFTRAANPSMSAYNYLMRVYLDLATHGAHLSRKIVTAGELSLEPLELTNYVTARENGRLYFVNPLTSEKLNFDQVFYVTAFGDGLTGYSPKDLSASTIGVAVSANESAASMYANELKPAGVLTSEAALDNEQVAAVRKNFEDISSGKQGNRLWLLESFLKYQPVTFNAEDAQLVQTRRFQIEEICRYVGVPPFLVFENSVTTQLGSSLEEMLNAYYDGAVKHLSTALSRAIEHQLLSDAEADKYEVQFDLTTARFASLKTRMEANSLAVNSGQLTPNEARASEGRGKLTGGDRLLVQGALAPLDSFP